MTPTAIRRWMVIAGVASMGVGVALLGYVLYAVFDGRIRLASRTTNVLVSFSVSPLAFLIGVSIYVLGGTVMVWAGLKLLRRK